MKVPTITVVLLVILALKSTAAAQSSSNSCSSLTGADATVVFPDTVRSDLAGASLAPGDVITAHNTSGLCVGELVWSDTTAQVMTIWGDDIVTDAIDGMVSGDTFALRILDVSAGVRYDASGGITFDTPEPYWQSDGRYVKNGLYLISSIQGSAAPVAAGAVGETGSVTVAQSDSRQWHRVTLQQSYNNPVVVLSPLSYGDADPAVSRVRSASASAFEFQIDEWDYLDGQHAAETISYLVVEAGTHTLEDGTLVQAGYADLGASQQSISFPSPFASVPVVLSQVASVKNSMAVTTRHQNMRANGFSAFLQSEEANPSPGTERVGWIALAEGTGTVGGKPYEVGRTPDAVTDTWYGVSFGSGFSGSPVFLAAMQSADGRDPARLRYRSLKASGVEVKVEEEQSRNPETKHKNEPVGYVLFEPGLIATSTQAQIAQVSSSSTLQRHVSFVPGDYALRGNYPNPFQGSTTIQYELPEQVHVRLEVFDLLGRRIEVLVDEIQGPGVYEVTFRADREASGTYLYSLRAGDLTSTGTMILVQ